MSRIRASIFILAVSGLLAACAAPPKRFEVARPLPPTALDVDGWDRLLREHVDAGRVDYPAFCTAPELPAFTDQVARVDLSRATASQQKSAYINAYNAYAIQGILDGRSPSTLYGRLGFFLRTRYPVAGQDITLYDLERDVLAAFADPRIQFTIICSSASCPRLRSGVYRPAALDADLDAAAVRFINDVERNRFDLDRGVAELSAIFDWYRGEFEAAAGSLEAYLANYVEDARVAQALRDGRLKLEFQEYDWSLNGTPPGPDDRCPAPGE
jgi:hypothetical protein